MTDSASSAQTATQPAPSAAIVREAAFALFGQFGYDGMSMTHLARECGLTKAGLYWHYDSKPALYADCMRQMVGLFQQHVFAAALAETEPVRQILAAFAGLESLLSDPRVAHGVAGYWLRPATAPVDEAIKVQLEFETLARQATTQILKGAEADGTLRLPLPADQVASAFIAQLEAIVLPLGKRDPTVHRHLVGMFAHMFFASYASDPALAADLAARLGAQS